MGGGFYSGFTRLRISEAWEFFGPANGVTDLQQMRQQVGHYRREDIGPGDDPVIGCLFIRDVRFFPPGDDAAPPPDFAPNVVQGKGYNLGTDTGLTAVVTGPLSGGECLGDLRPEREELVGEDYLPSIG